MSNYLLRLASRLSEREIHELLRLKKDNLKKAKALRKQRAALAASLEKLDRRIAEMTGGAAAPVAGPGTPILPPDAQAGPAKPGSKAGKPTAQKSRKGRRAGRMEGLTAAIRMVFANAKDQNLRAYQIVRALPEIGIKVDDFKSLRRRVSILLAHKPYFKRVDYGLYRLKG